MKKAVILAPLNKMCIVHLASQMQHEQRGSTARRSGGRCSHEAGMAAAGASRGGYATTDAVHPKHGTPAAPRKRFWPESPTGTRYELRVTDGTGRPNNTAAAAAALPTERTATRTTEAEPADTATTA